MTNKEKRNAEIEMLSQLVREKAQRNKGGSACLVPSASDGTVIYTVDIDENYNPIGCRCQGGRGNCKHKAACTLYFAPKLERLLNDAINPRYQFERNGKMIAARLSQFSKEERQALRQQEAEQARKDADRNFYNTIFDPNYINDCKYA